MIKSNKSIKWLPFIWLLFFKAFRYWLSQTIFYALENYNENRGNGSSDVAIFDSGYRDIIIKEK